MNRYLYSAIVALVFTLPQVASAESVSFGAKLDGDGGHIGGSASGNTGAVTGQIHWHGTSIDIDSGIVIGFNGLLQGKIKRSNDPSLTEGTAVSVYLNSEANFVQLSIPSVSKFYYGNGHVTIR